MASGLKNFFSNEFETNYGDDRDVTSHYYGNDYNKTKEAVIQAGKRLGYDATNIDDKYKEIFLASKTKGEIIVTIRTFSYYENSVDFKVITHYIIPRGRAKKFAELMYQDLDRLLVLKRKGDYNEW